MIGSIFVLIQAILKAIGLWERFLSELDKRRLAEAEEKRQKREKAVEDSKKAGTDDEIWDSQDDITNTLP